MTFTAPRSKHSSVDHGRISISLPQMPFDVPPAVTDETAPSIRMVTCGYDWRKDPVLRSAAGKAGVWNPAACKQALEQLK